MSDGTHKSKDKGLKKYIVISTIISIGVLVSIFVFDYTVDYSDPVDPIMTSDQVQLTITKMQSDMVDIFQTERNINERRILNNCRLSVDYSEQNLMIVITDCPILNYDYNIVHRILTDEIDLTWCDGQLVKIYGKYDLKDQFKEIYSCEK